MPQRFADVLEPKMQKVAKRIPEINRLKRPWMGSAC